jgi:uncharacterized protein (TIGR04222 family)
MFNPFDLHGPAFLLFYACLGVAVALALRASRRRNEEGPAPRIDTSDPYLIAYLRGGKNEAARVAAVSLVDRGLLKEEGDDKLWAVGGSGMVRRPIEKALLRVFAHPAAVGAMFNDREIEDACREFQDHLTRRGCLPNEDVRAQRRRLFMMALAVLLGVAAIKIAVALGRGRTNIVFLIVFAIVLTIVCWNVVNRRRTRRGDETMQDLQRLFARLEARALSLVPGGANADAVMLAAVFGVTALPSAGFAYAHRLFRKSKSSDSSGGGGCGSSCGSSAGSSCGGGGGGCGGCGGGGD